MRRLDLTERNVLQVSQENSYVHVPSRVSLSDFGRLKVMAVRKMLQAQRRGTGKRTSQSSKECGVSSLVAYSGAYSVHVSDVNVSQIMATMYYSRPQEQGTAAAWSCSDGVMAFCKFPASPYPRVNALY